jgi:DNA recombination protein RmuC
MEMILMLLLGLGLGALVGSSWTSIKAKSELARVQGDLRVAEATASDLRDKQTESKAECGAKNADLKGLQQQLRVEGELKAAAQAELRQARASLEEFASIRDKFNIESQLRVAAETKLKETEVNLEEQRKLLDGATARLSDTFGSLSAEALKSNNQAFLALAKSTRSTGSWLR